MKKLKRVRCYSEFHARGRSSDNDFQVNCYLLY